MLLCFASVFFVEITCSSGIIQNCILRLIKKTDSSLSSGRGYDIASNICLTFTWIVYVVGIHFVEPHACHSSFLHSVWFDVSVCVCVCVCVCVNKCVQCCNFEVAPTGIMSWHCEQEREVSRPRGTRSRKKSARSWICQLAWWKQLASSATARSKLQLLGTCSQLERREDCNKTRCSFPS
jgi:hypothetical protein